MPCPVRPDQRVYYTTPSAYMTTPNYNIMVLAFDLSNSQAYISSPIVLSVAPQVSAPSSSAPVMNTFHPQSSQPPSDPTPQAFVATPDIVSDNAWYMDSGATQHIAKDSSQLQQYVPYHGSGKVCVGNGHPEPIFSVGHVSLKSFDASNDTLHMNCVLCVPSITKNLCSVSQFTKENGVSVEFFPHASLVKDL